MNDEDDELDRSAPYSTHFDSSAVHHSINPDCPVCSKPVFWSRHISCLDRVWHVQCFICSYCYKPLKPGEQSFHGGKIFCTEPCFNELFLDQQTNSKAVAKAKIGHRTETEQKTKQKQKMEKDRKAETIDRRTETEHKTATDPKTVTTDHRTVIEQKKKTQHKAETLRAENNDNDKIDQQTKPENNKCSWTARVDHHTPCLHCVKCDHPIVNHRELTDDQCPQPKFSGCKENVEIHWAANAQQIRDTRRPTRNLNANFSNSPMNRSVQASDFIGQRCVRCLKKVFLAELCFSINSVFHLNCLRCSICNRALQPAAHAVHDGLPICHFPCYNRVFNSNPYRKGWHECRP